MLLLCGPECSTNRANGQENFAAAEIEMRIGLRHGQLRISFSFQSIEKGGASLLASVSHSDGNPDKSQGFTRKSLLNNHLR